MARKPGPFEAQFRLMAGTGKGIKLDEIPNGKPRGEKLALARVCPTHRLSSLSGFVELPG